jgi:hypothetical protein
MTAAKRKKAVPRMVLADLPDTLSAPPQTVRAARTVIRESVGWVLDEAAIMQASKHPLTIALLDGHVRSVGKHLMLALSMLPKERLMALGRALWEEADVARLELDQMIADLSDEDQ